VTSSWPTTTASCPYNRYDKKLPVDMGHLVTRLCTCLSCLPVVTPSAPVVLLTSSQLPRPAAVPQVWSGDPALAPAIKLKEWASCSHWAVSFCQLRISLLKQERRWSRSNWEMRKKEGMKQEVAIGGQKISFCKGGGDTDKLHHQSEQGNISFCCKNCSKEFCKM